MNTDHGQGALFGTPAEVPAGDRHAALLQALADHLEAGLIVPCVASPAKDSPWTTNDPALADEAALACPALVECRDYAVAAREPAAVWGGLTAGERIMRPRRRPAPDDPFPGTTTRSRSIHQNRKKS